MHADVDTHMPGDTETATPTAARSARCSAAAVIAIALVRLYQGTLGPWLGGHCRFRPTCSQYMIDAVSRYGALRGGWRGLRRVTRCHPWGGMGDDPA